MIKYAIEFDIPDNETTRKSIKTDRVQWRFLGYGGYCMAQPVIHAHWIHDFIDADWNCGVEIHCGWICSHCGGYAEMESKTPYCPFCGAKMDEVIE